MGILKNSRHEKFARAVFKGMSQKDAAIEAGYKPSRARFTGANLATYRNIIDRIKELHTETACADVMTVKERKKRLSELGRANIPDFITDDGIKVEKGSPNVGAVREITTKTKVYRKSGDPVYITKIKLYNPVKAIAELNRMEGEYKLPNVLKVEIEPGEKMEPILTELLSRIRGYGSKE